MRIHFAGMLAAVLSVVVSGHAVQGANPTENTAGKPLISTGVTGSIGASGLDDPQSRVAKFSIKNARELINDGASWKERAEEWQWSSVHDYTGGLSATFRPNPTLAIDGILLPADEGRLRGRIVVGHVRPAVRFGNSQPGDQKPHRLRGHGLKHGRRGDPCDRPMFAPARGDGA